MDDQDNYYLELAKGRSVPLGRTGEADEAADLIAFLASARSSYITGTAINMDGFRTLTEGQKVQFDVTRGPKGLQAQNVRPA